MTWKCRNTPYLPAIREVSPDTFVIYLVIYDDELF